MKAFEDELNELKRCHTFDDFIRPVGRWSEVVPHIHPRHGGISAVVPQLSSRLAMRANYSISLDAFCGSEESSGQSIQPEITLRHWPSSRVDWRSQELKGQLREKLRSSDGAHLHGLWTSSTDIAASTMRDLRKPYIVSAHGMLEPWALAQKKWKKKLYAFFKERTNLRQAACLHALTEGEAQAYRNFGSRAPIAVIPNGIEIPDIPDRELFLKAFPDLRDRRIILYLGRLHVKKGVELLIDAWSAQTARFPEAVLVLAGPGTSEYRNQLERRAASAGNRIVFTGMLNPPMKWSALACAECFALPSYSEGLSVATLEAMGMGLPVIITEECNLPEVSGSGAGWEIRSNVLELSAAIQNALRNSPEQNAIIGARGRALVKERFTWESVTEQMADLYQWVQGGPRPTKFSLQEVKA